LIRDGKGDDLVIRIRLMVGWFVGFGRLGWGICVVG
jgi:hypothetical protein